MAGHIYNWGERPLEPGRYLDLKRHTGDWLGIEAWNRAYDRIWDGGIPPFGLGNHPVDAFRLEVEGTHDPTVGPTPMVFISHRQCDTSDAIALANEIVLQRPHYDIWLDVWDPTLSNLGASPASDASKALLIALTIEMGLLNATCLVALITAGAAGSTWIPYEYGRVKPNSVFSVNVAARISAGVSGPEYFNLGPKLADNTDVINWLH